MNQPQQRPGAGGYNRDQQPALPYETMTKYYDGNNVLRREVFVDWPKQVAQSIGISRTNLRRAYDFVAAMHFRIGMGEDAVKVLQPGMGEFSRFVQYQSARDRNWEGARNFFQSQINAVGSDKDKFEGFYQLFQSVMAYSRSK